MTLNYNSYYKDLANKSVSWLPMDSEELYNENLKKNYSLLESNNWINNPFTYSFNSNGFRCGEFTGESSIMFLGCSMTMGIGLPEHTRWTDIVASSLNLRCANLGIGGSSSDTAFRLCHGWIDIIKPNLVIFYRPPGIRNEVVTDTTIINIAAPYTPGFNYFKNWIVDDNNNTFNFLKNTLAIEHLCQLRSIKCVHVSDNSETIKDDWARDLSHPGIRSNAQLAEKTLSLI